jgi:hypothetical protein
MFPAARNGRRLAVGIDDGMSADVRVSLERFSIEMSDEFQLMQN